MTGTISRVFADRGFCFVRVSGGGSAFLHIHDLERNGALFDDQLTERTVEFDLVHEDKGDRARNARLVSPWLG